METNVNYTVVGAFVIAITTIIILCIIWLSSGFSYGQYTSYQVLMEESVSGLSVDSPVEFNGVNVGTVTKMELDHDNPQIVTILLSIKKSTPVTMGTEAILNVRGLTGVAFMALRDKGTDQRPLVTEKDQAYPIIKTSPSFFLRLEDAVTKVTDSLKEVSRSIRSLLDQENLRTFKEILLNVRSITDNFVVNRGRITSILNNTANASAQFPALMSESQAAMQQFSGQTLPAANAAVSNLDITMENLSRVSRELRQNPSVMIRGKTQPALGPGE